MRIFILFILLLSSNFLWASQSEVLIKVANHTGTDCILQKYYVLYGQIQESTPIPNTLFRDQNIEFKIKPKSSYYREHKEKSVILYYHCGDNQSIDLFTVVAPFQGMFIENTYVLQSHNMKAFAKTHNRTGNMFDRSPVEIYWTLEPFICQG